MAVETASGIRHCETCGCRTDHRVETDHAAEETAVTCKVCGTDPDAEPGLPTCPHGCGDMVEPVPGDPLESASPYCPDCGHIDGNDCDDGCHYTGDGLGDWGVAVPGEPICQNFDAHDEGVRMQTGPHEGYLCPECGRTTSGELDYVDEGDGGSP